jgi:hypothetical protein
VTDPLVDEWLAPDFVDYEVCCARCGLRLMASEALVEEGDEWECLPCWERCNAQERGEKP